MAPVFMTGQEIKASGFNAFDLVLAEIFEYCRHQVSEGDTGQRVRHSLESRILPLEQPEELIGTVAPPMVISHRCDPVIEHLADARAIRP